MESRRISLCVWFLVSLPGFLCDHSCQLQHLSARNTKGVQIVSPLFPLHYKNNQDACWIFTVDRDTLEVSISTLRTGDGNDKLSIYDGDSEKATQLGEMSGYAKDETYTSTGETLYVHWSTDDKHTGPGFIACICPSESWCDCMDDDGNGGVTYDNSASTEHYPPLRHKRRFPTMILGIVLSVMAVIAIVVASVLSHRCRRHWMTPHPDSHAECSRRELSLELGKDCTFGDGETSNGRPWIMPVAPPAYTAFTLPPPYGGMEGMPVTHVPRPDTITVHCSRNEVSGDISALPMSQAAARQEDDPTPECGLHQVDVNQKTTNAYEVRHNQIDDDYMNI